MDDAELFGPAVQTTISIVARHENLAAGNCSRRERFQLWNRLTGMLRVRLIQGDSVAQQDTITVLDCFVGKGRHPFDQNVVVMAECYEVFVRAKGTA